MRVVDAEVTYPPDVESEAELEVVWYMSGMAGYDNPVELGTVLVVIVSDAETAATSLGTTSGVVPASFKSIEPSLMVSMLFPTKLRVNRTFSATYWWDHSGSCARSMLFPQLAANALPFVWDDVYWEYAATPEF